MRQFVSVTLAVLIVALAFENVIATFELAFTNGAATTTLLSSTGTTGLLLGLGVAKVS